MGSRGMNGRAALSLALGLKHTLSRTCNYSAGDNERDVVRGASRRKRLVRHAISILSNSTLFTNCLSAKLD